MEDYNFVLEFLIKGILVYAYLSCASDAPRGLRMLLSKVGILPEAAIQVPKDTFISRGTV